MTHLLLAFQGSTPGFSTSAFSCSQTQNAPGFGTFLQHEKACLKNYKAVLHNTCLYHI